MRKTKVNIEVMLERRALLFLPRLSCGDWTHIASNRAWVPKDKLTDEEAEEASDYRAAEDIAASIINQLFGFTRRGRTSGDDGLKEICQGGPQLCVTVDLVDMPFTLRSLRRALRRLAVKLLRGDRFYSDPDYVRRPGPGDPIVMYGPTRIEAYIDVPKSVRACLVKKEQHHADLRLERKTRKS